MTGIDEEATKALHGMVPYAETLGIEVLASSAEEVRARVAWSEAGTTLGGALNGGVLMGLADNTGALCAFQNLPEGSAGTSTVESKTNFLRAVRAGHATAVSRPLHVGRRFVVVETDITDDDGRLVARVTQTQAVL
ncbi:PaaI family thioesterase [Actinophytocola gossypii]|uniref:PaaI family thioesterase n=1 Tax=Actinophytocola gossypii TaxID=2812003 RepID=A0ABT2J5J1_9PSEU|nr:PaaI family thioesterase [Actinophytocola gossypii]MCT2582760.1 PaaI family thioesterase [Actinophytocola gossypii]